MKWIHKISDFLFHQHKMISIITGTAIACIGITTAIVLPVESHIYESQTKGLIAKMQSSSSIEEISEVSSSDISSITISSQAASSQNMSSPSIPQSTSSSTQSIISAASKRKQDSSKAGSTTTIPSSISSQPQQASSYDINKSDYAITIRHTIDQYKTSVQQDTVKVNEDKANLKATQNQKNTWEITSNGTWAMIADPTKVKNAQDQLTKDQSTLNYDQKELNYWESIAKNDGITY